MQCSTEGCENQATHHITYKLGLADQKSVHYCLACFQSVVGDSCSVGEPTSRRLEPDSLCATCGNDNSTCVAADGSPSFTCPDCGREIRDATNDHHEILIDTIMNPVIIRECRIVPVAIDANRIIVLYDFVNIDDIYKLRFLTNASIVAMFAESKRIDSLIANI